MVKRVDLVDVFEIRFDPLNSPNPRSIKQNIFSTNIEKLLIPKS